MNNRKVKGVKPSVIKGLLITLYVLITLTVITMVLSIAFKVLTNLDERTINTLMEQGYTEQESKNMLE